MPYKDPEKRRESGRKGTRIYRLANLEKCREAVRAWTAANPEKIREKDHAWTAANPKRVRKNKRAWQVANPEKVLKANRAYVARNPDKRMELNLKTYGISLQKYKEMLASQKGVCAVCGNNQNKRRLGVDHNHITGEIRGLLCHGCNVALGYARDDPLILRKLAEYIEKKLPNEGR